MAQVRLSAAQRTANGYRKRFRIGPAGSDWVASAFVLILLAWVVTNGDWEFFPRAASSRSTLTRRHKV